MSLGFDNPALLPLLPLAGLPLLLHLMARPRPRRIDFPSLMLLERARRDNARIKRPHHWLLLLLRTLWVLAILGVFLQPRHYSERPPAGLETYGRAVVIVLDATASMRAGEGAQSRHARAAAEAADILRGLSARDRANLIRVRALPESLYPEPAVNKRHLIDEVRRLPATLEGGSLHEAFQLAATQLRDIGGPREIILISDFQPGSWTPADLQPPEGVTVRLLTVAAESIPNQTVTALRITPPAPGAGQDFTVEAEIHNHADTPERRALTLRAGERVEQHHVDLPPRGTAVITAVLRLADPGTVPVTAELEADRFPADDRRRAVLHIRPSLRAAVHGTDETAALWLRTLQAFPEIEAARLHRLDEFDDTLDLLLISDWDGRYTERLRAFTQRGGLLMIRPGPLPDTAAHWLGLQTAHAPETRLDPPLGLTIPDPWPDTLRLFRDGRHGSPARGLVHRHAPLQPLPDTHTPLLLLETGEPVWLRHRENPTLFLWALSLDPRHSTLAAQTEWIPLIGEWIFGSIPARGPAPAEAGDHLPLSRVHLPAARPELIDRHGTLHPLDIGEQTVRARDPLPPGLYRHRNADTGETLHLHAVNLPPAESDLTAQAPEALHSDGISLMARASELSTLREGRPLWPLLLALAFLFALLEQLATLRAVRT